MNEYNEEIRLTGASHGNGGLNKQQREYSLESLDTLRSWGGNLFRLFIDGKSKYSSMYNYIGNEDDYINTLSNAIDNAIASDMYVLIVWSPHASNASDPLKANAIDAFTRVANLYPNDPHIIYEIWNEPGTSSWTEIKNYANDVIPQIRAISPDSIVVVGTPSNDSGIDGPIGDEITLGNVMYTSHIYAGTFSGTYNDKLINAINNGLPVFETEMAGTEVGETTNDLVYEAQISALASILNKYNISYAFFVWHSTNWSYGITHKTWNEKLPDHLLSNNGKFFKRMLRDDFYYNVKLLEEQVTASDYRTEEWRDKIVSVRFEDSINIPGDAVQTWDVSFAKDNSIIGYLLPTETADMYDLVIAANGKIAGSLNCRALFSGMSNVKSVDFTNFVTNNVNNTAYMFYNNKNLLNLDLTTFNVDSLTNISYMFNGCEKLKSLNISNWKIKPTSINTTFVGMKAIEELDLRGIDVSDISDFRYVFNVNTKLKRIDISTWNPKNVAKMNAMFNATYALESVDMRLFNVTSETEVTQALNGVKANAKFVVKSQEVADLLVPTATNTVQFEVR